MQTLAEIATGQDQEQRIAQISTVNVDIEGGGTQAVSLAEATIGPDGQIILTGEDGTQSSTYWAIPLVASTNLLVFS